MKVIYDAAMEKWEVSGIAPAPMYFDSAEEAHNVMSKTKFVENLQELMNALGKVMDEGPDMVQAYFDRTYNSNASNEIVDSDIATTGLTAAQAGSMITVLQNFTAFCVGGSPTVDTYRVTINTTRSDK